MQLIGLLVTDPITAQSSKSGVIIVFIRKIFRNLYTPWGFKQMQTFEEI